MEVREFDRRYWILLIISALVLLVFPFVYVIAPFTGYTYLELTEIVAPAGSIVLAIVLAFLYLNLGISQERQTELIEKQTDIQEKQNVILERQVALERTQFEPDIEVLESSPGSPDLDFGVEGNLYTVNLINKGGGVANHLNLWCELLYNDVDGFVTIDELDLRINGRRYDIRPALVSLVSFDQLESKQIQHHGSYLEPAGTAEFQAEIGFLGADGGAPSESIVFTDILQVLRENEINNLDVHLWLVYTDQIGENHYSKVESGHFDVYQTEDFEDAISGHPGHFQLEDDTMMKRIEELQIEPMNVHQRY